MIRYLYDQKKQPQEIIGYLAWYLRTIGKIVFLSDKTSSVREIASKIKYSPAYTKRLMDQSKKYSAEKLDGWVELLLKTDRDIKTGKKAANLALEELITTFLSS